MGMGCVCVAGGVGVGVGGGGVWVRRIAQIGFWRHVVRGGEEKSIAQHDCRQNVSGFSELATCVQIPCQIGHIWTV